MSASNLSSTVCLLACFLVQSLSEDQQQITVKPGDNVPLRCLDPRGGDKVLEWSRQDLKDEGYVFYFKGKPLIEDYQHPSFHDRVELKDPDRKNGNFSVILKNVTINDTGTYECHVANKGSKPQFINSIKLTVTESGGGAGRSEDGGDKDGGDKDGGDKDGGHVGLTVGVTLTVLLVVVVVVVVVVVIYRKLKGHKH